MKIVLLLIAATFFASMQLISSQIIINKSDFPIHTSYVSEDKLSHQDNMQPPAIGDNQTWNLTNLEIQEEYSIEYFDAKGDEFYTDAVYYTPTTYSLDKIHIQSLDFFKIDDNGYTKEGRRIEEIVYPITQLTGGPNDNLKIIGGNFPFDGRGDLIQFPAEFGKSWEQSYVIPTNYELTVEAYGLDHTPGQFMQTNIQTRTVVGSGKLTMPNKNGGVMTIDALLIKNNTTTIDSVFLGGQPAPPALMSAFKIEQGATLSVEQYVFYAPGYGFSIAAYDLTEKYISYQSLSGPTTNVESANIEKLSVYPNPVKSGASLNISNSTMNICNLVLVDLSGKVVLENNISGNSNLNIPNTITAGAYLLNSYDSNGKILSSNKVIIE